MKTTNPFHDDAEHMAREFKRLATERAAEYEAEEVENYEPGVKVAEE
ncbi:hypothetical protein [Nocardioides sp. SYSU DS0651]